jgi:hypothetical protein
MRLNVPKSLALGALPNPSLPTEPSCRVDRCGRCAKDHSTRECPSNSDPSVPTTCANCGLQGHRPTNLGRCQPEHDACRPCPVGGSASALDERMDSWPGSPWTVQVDNVQVIVGGRNFQSEAEQQAQAQIAMSRAALAYVVTVVKPSVSCVNSTS